MRFRPTQPLRRFPKDVHRARAAPPCARRRRRGRPLGFRDVPRLRPTRTGIGAVALLLALAAAPGAGHAAESSAEPEARETPETPAQSLADRRLSDLAQREQAFYEKLENNPDAFDQAAKQRRLREFAQGYRAYLDDHPENVHALVLYAKLLRRAGHEKKAFRAFLKADALKPDIAVVKQQIGAYLAERGKGKAALPFHLLCVELRPEEPVYQFQLGQLLATFRDTFIDDGIYSAAALDRAMLRAFRNAAEQQPGNIDFQMRLGEAYYDVASPDWEKAYAHWQQVREQADRELLRDIVDLHRARVLGKLGRHAEAIRLARTTETPPALDASRDELLRKLRKAADGAPSEAGDAP